MSRAPPTNLTDYRRTTQMPHFPSSITPDLNMRAGRMLAAGNLTATVTSNASSIHVTARFRCIADNRDRLFEPTSKKNWIPCDLARATHVFIEVPNQSDWADKVGTFYPKTGRFYADDKADHARVWAAVAIACWVQGQDFTQGMAVIQEESRCGVCSRPLTDPVSIERCIGPGCFGRSTGSQHQVKSGPTMGAALEDAIDHPKANPLPTTDGLTIAEQRDEHEQLKLEAQQPPTTTLDVVLDCIEQLNEADLRKAMMAIRHRMGGALGR